LQSAQDQWEEDEEEGGVLKSVSDFADSMGHWCSVLGMFAQVGRAKRPRRVFLLSEGEGGWALGIKIKLGDGAPLTRPCLTPLTLPNKPDPLVGLVRGPGSAWVLPDLPAFRFSRDERLPGLLLTPGSAGVGWIGLLQ